MPFFRPLPPEPADARLWELQDDDDDNDDDDGDDDEVGADADEKPNIVMVNHYCRSTTTPAAAAEVPIFSLNGALIQEETARRHLKHRRYRTIEEIETVL